MLGLLTPSWSPSSTPVSSSNPPLGCPGKLYYWGCMSQRRVRLRAQRTCLCCGGDFCREIIISVRAALLPSKSVDAVAQPTSMIIKTKVRAHFL